MKKVIAILIVVVVLNTALWLLPSSITTFSTQKETLHPLTTELLSSVNKDVNIFHVVKAGDADENIVRLLGQMTAGNDKIQVQTIAPDSEAAANLSQSELTSNTLVVTAGSRTMTIPYSYIYENSDSSSAETEETQSPFRGEAMLDEAISYVLVENDYTAYLLGGADDTSAKQTVKMLENDFTDIKLIGEADSEIPEDALCVMIYQSISSTPADITDHELELAQAYLANGGKLMVVTNGIVSIAQDQESGTYSYTAVKTPNIDALLAAYGVKRDTTLILESDEQQCFQSYSYYTGAYSSVKYASVPDLYVDGYKGDDLYFFCPEPIVKLEDSPENVTMTELAKSLKTSYLDADFWAKYVAQEDIVQEDDDAKGPFTTGVRLEDKKTDAQIIWLSAALADSQGYPDVELTTTLLQSFVDGEVKEQEERTDYTVIPSLDLDEAAPLELSEALTGAWFLSTLIVLPVVILVIGILVTYIRKTKTK